MSSAAVIAGRALRWIAVAVAFVAVTSLFAMLLKPLAGPREAGRAVVVPVAPERRLAAAADAPTAALATPQVKKSGVASAAPSAVPAAVPAGPKLGILVTELGADPVLARKAIAMLPPAIGLAFSPGAPMARALAAEAARAGHETWVGLPLQPRGWPRTSPGTNTLLLADTPARKVERTRWALSQIDRPAGVYTMMGSAFVTDAAALGPVVATVKDAGLVLLDARVVAGTKAATAMTAAGGKALSNDGFIDPGADIDRVLARLVRQARARGQAIGIAGARAATIQRLVAFAGSAQAEGIQLVSPGRLAR